MSADLNSLYQTTVHQRVEIADLRAENDALKKERDDWFHCARQAEDNNQILRKERDELASALVGPLVEALERYGCHLSNCNCRWNTGQCTCGLDAVLAQHKERIYGLHDAAPASYKDLSENLNAKTTSIS